MSQNLEKDSIASLFVHQIFQLALIYINLVLCA